MLNKIFKVQVYTVTREIAEDILKPRLGNACFFVNNGGPICSLSDLCIALEQMPGETYLYHANRERNDFAKWVKGTLSDDQLSAKLLKCKNQEIACATARARFNELTELTNSDK
jgi:hypothetical protein